MKYHITLSRLKIASFTFEKDRNEMLKIFRKWNPEYDYEKLNDTEL